LLNGVAEKLKQAECVIPEDITDKEEHCGTWVDLLLFMLLSGLLMELQISVDQRLSN